MQRYVWWGRPARSAIEAMSESERREYDVIEQFLSESPYPITGSKHIEPTTQFGVHGFRYFDDRFPYSIFYRVDEHEIEVMLVLRSATRRTPL